MDVSMQSAMRHFVRQYNERHGATVILTSHYMEDVAALCDRIVVIEEGRLRFDGSIDALVREIRPLRRVSVSLGEERPKREEVERWGEVVEASERRLILDVEPERVPEVVGWLMQLGGSHELGVADAPLEEVMRDLFAQSKGNPG